MPYRTTKLIARRYQRRLYRRKGRRGGMMNKPLGWYAKKAWQGVKMLRGLVNAEKKFIDISISGAPGTTPSVSCLNIVAQGNTDSTRNGDSILAKYITLREQITMSPTGASDNFRVVYVLDKENRGALPAWTDIFDASNTIARLNKNNMDRFVILKDQTYSLSPGARPTITLKHTIKCPFHIKFGSNNGDITDVRQNSVFRCVIASDNANKTNHFCESRLAFYDN